MFLLQQQTVPPQIKTTELFHFQYWWELNQAKAGRFLLAHWPCRFYRFHCWYKLETEDHLTASPLASLLSIPLAVEKGTSHCQPIGHVAFIGSTLALKEEIFGVSMAAYMADSRHICRHQEKYTLTWRFWYLLTSVPRRKWSIQAPKDLLPSNSHIFVT